MLGLGELTLFVMVKGRFSPKSFITVADDPKLPMASSTVELILRKKLPAFFAKDETVAVNSWGGLLAGGRSKD
jgi:hypothetical protein